MAPYEWRALCNIIEADASHTPQPYYVSRQWYDTPPPGMNETDLENLRVAYERKFGLKPQTQDLTWRAFQIQGLAAFPTDAAAMKAYYAAHDFIRFYNDWVLRLNDVDISQEIDANTKKPGKSVLNKEKRISRIGQKKVEAPAQAPAKALAKALAEVPATAKTNSPKRKTKDQLPFDALKKPPSVKRMRKRK